MKARKGREPVKAPPRAPRGARGNEAAAILLAGSDRRRTAGRDASVGDENCRVDGARDENEPT